MLRNERIIIIFTPHTVVMPFTHTHMEAAAQRNGYKLKNILRICQRYMQYLFYEI